MILEAKLSVLYRKADRTAIFKRSTQGLFPILSRIFSWLRAKTWPLC